ncbi:TetR family transcriptional regulator [Mycobacterium tuberculosis]|nr:TetR family transcriptional regulator [Mycobacterium tuberculosis]
MGCGEGADAIWPARHGWQVTAPARAATAPLTMDSVAARAGTGIAVLYRRWANKDQLVLAVLDYYRNSHPVDIPDTGSLRGDHLDTVRRRCRSRPAAALVRQSKGLTTRGCRPHRQQHWWA